MKGRPTAILPWPTAGVLASALFLVLFDSLAVSTALPTIGAELTSSASSLQWVVSLYSLSIGGLLMFGGRLCDLWDRRAILIASLLLSSVASLMAGLAPNLPVLLVGRGLQGVAAAFALPSAMATAATVFSSEPWRSRVFSVVAVAANVAGIAGAICGGLLTDTLGWRWVFLAPVPITLLAIGAAVVLLPQSPPRASSRVQFNVAGVVLASAGMAALLYGCGQFGESSGTGRGVGWTAVGLALLGALVGVERRSTHPLVSPALVRSRRLVGSCLAFATHCAAHTLIVVVGSIYLQDVQGLSPVQVGLVLAPVLLAAMTSAAPAGALVRRYGARAVVAVSLTLCGVALTMIALNDDGDLGDVVPWFVAWGFSAGPIYVGLTHECVGDAAEEDRGTASALLESTSHVAGAIATAVYLTLLSAHLGYQVVHLCGAVGVAAGAVATMVILPSRQKVTAERPTPDRGGPAPR